MPNTSTHLERSNSAASTTTCAVCCYEKTHSEMYRLCHCSHVGCRDCFAQWIQRAEQSGQTDFPICPFCRIPFQELDIRAIMGRDFKPRAANSASMTIPSEVELDDLTLQWLEANTKTCPGCSARIENAGGCDLFECLCGYRFCYACGAHGGTCSCTPPNHLFWDNVFDRLSSRQVTPPQAPRNQETGCVDIQRHLTNRRLTKKKWEREQQRAKRRASQEASQRAVQRWRRAEKLVQARDHSDMSNSALCYGHWLFACRTRAGTLQLLQELSPKHKQMRDQRDIAHRRNTFRIRRKVEQRAQVDQKSVITSGKWLFCPRNKGLNTLQQLLTRGFDQRERSKQAWRRAANFRQAMERDDTSSNCALYYGHWLFADSARTDTIQLLDTLSQKQKKNK